MQKIILLGLTLSFSGCVWISEVIENTANTKPHRYKAVEICNLDSTIKIIQKENTSQLLKNAEQGLAYYFHKDYKKSNEYLDQAIKQYRIYEDRAILSTKNTLYQEYQGEKYDKVFMHNYKALNYLMLGEIEKAKSESYMSSHFQDKVYASFEKFKQTSKQQLDGHLRTKYHEIFSAVEPQHHPFKNPFASYVQSLAYAENGRWNNALKALEIAKQYAPSSKVLQKKYNEYKNKILNRRVELFFDVGQSPLKEQVQLQLKMGQSEERQAYFPSFEIHKSDVAYIKIIDSKNHEVARSFLLSDINAIKVNEFKAKVPHLVYMPIKQTAISAGSMVLKPYPMIRAGFNLITTIFSQYSKLTWSLLPQKILVASFIPKQNETYTLEVISNRGILLDRTKIKLKKSKETKNIYQHFLIRDEKLCK